MSKEQPDETPIDSETVGAWPENIVAQRHEVSGNWWLMYLDDQQVALCQQALMQRPKREFVQPDGCPYCGSGACKVCGRKLEREPVQPDETTTAKSAVVQLTGNSGGFNCSEIPSSSSKREIVTKPMEAMCDRARGFIIGLDLGYRTWEEMDTHLDLGGYPTLLSISHRAQIDPQGHITKWDVAQCIYLLMNSTDIESEATHV